MVQLFDLAPGESGIEIQSRFLPELSFRFLIGQMENLTRGPGTIPSEGFRTTMCVHAYCKDGHFPPTDLVIAGALLCLADEVKFAREMDLNRFLLTAWMSRAYWDHVKRANAA